MFLSLAGLALLFGLRHALDADHLAAIDNVVRKLAGKGWRGYSVGLFFSLGHSTVVVLACAFLAGAWSVPWVQQFTSVMGTIGTGVSATFLFLIALANILTLFALWRGDTGEEGLPGGLMLRFLRPVFNAVSRPGHMYLVGFLFGLGFDTATEIGVLSMSAGLAVHGIGFWQIMLLPLLFAAGMTILDTADSVVMAKAYGWAIGNPRWHWRYNLCLTSLTAAFAIIVGGAELVGYGLW